MSVIFVGDRPSTLMQPNAMPFEGAACEKRLKSWIKRLKATDFFIVNSYRMTPHWWAWFKSNGHTFIALGNEASSRLDACSIKHFKLPHPSGLNRQINNKTFITKQLRLCRKFIAENK